MSRMNEWHGVDELVYRKRNIGRLVNLRTICDTPYLLENMSRFRGEDLQIFGLCWYSESITDWYKSLHKVFSNDLAVQITFWFYSFSSGPLLT